MRGDLVRAIFLRELRDVLRDRRTLFTMLVLPVILYPVLLIGFGTMTKSRVERLKDRTYPVMLSVDGVVVQDGSPDAPGGTLLHALAKVPQFRFTRAEDPEEAIRQGELLLALDLPGDLEERLGRDGGEPVVLAPIRDSANDEARTVWAAFEAAVQGYRQQRLPLAIDGTSQDLASAEKRGGHLFGSTLAMIVIMMAMTGAFYPALDLAAGEKERGTLETLLLSPASRLELVAGKYLTVLAVALVAALMNLGSMAITLSRLPRLLGGGRDGVPTLSLSAEAFFIILLGLVIMAGLFSAVCLALSTFARTYKEGQTYLTPALLVVIPLAMAGILPAMNLDRSMAIVPVTNMALLMKALFVGSAPWVETVLCLLSNLVLTGAALFWTAGLFSREEVLFREGRQVFGLRPPPGVPRPARPGFTAALLGISFAMVWMVQASMHFLHYGIPVVVIATNAGLGLIGILLAALSMAPFRSGIALKLPAGRGWIAGLCLGAGGFFLSLTLGYLQRHLLGDPQEASSQMEQMLRPLLDGPVWITLLVLAVLPAVCEEILFRGLVLQGSRRALGDGGAVLLSAASFALLHNLGDTGFHRFFPQFALGALLAVAVIRTGSLWPAILAHGIHNGVLVAIVKAPGEAAAGPEPSMLLWSIPAAAILIALSLLAGGRAADTRGAET